MEWNKETPAEAPVQVHLGGLGSVVIIAIVAMTIVLVVGLVVSHQSVVVALVLGALFFSSITLTSLLILSGALTRIVTNGQVQKTERLKISKHYQVLDSPVDPLPALSMAPSGPLLPSRNFVHAVEPEVARGAILWALALYEETGEPSDSKVNLKTGKELPGRLKVPAPSDSRVKEYLLHKNVLQNIRNGYRLNTNRYSDAGSLKELLL